ncbi:hypothetical protein BGY98DRAFT_1095996 [Russula aff. rugulosa BPL654]|nr:hypothetical protein BGY98DRAFT_1095996 [Russula aff. rugulosa BPL654]
MSPKALHSAISWTTKRPLLPPHVSSPFRTLMHLTAVLDWDIQHFGEEPRTRQRLLRNKMMIDEFLHASWFADPLRRLILRIVTTGVLTHPSNTAVPRLSSTQLAHRVLDTRTTLIYIATASHTLDAISILDATGAVVDREFEIRARPAQHHLGTER